MRTPLPETTTGAISIRIANLDDLPAIVTIYNQAIPSHRSTANTNPVTVESRTAWFVEHTAGEHPIFVAEIEGRVVGWCSLSAYRPGRAALRYTAEISCYIGKNNQHQGVGYVLVSHVVEACRALNLKNLIAVLIDQNQASKRLLEKLGFEQWGYLPRVLDFDGQEFGEFYYGKRVAD